MQIPPDEIDAGDIVLTPGEKLGIVVGIYGMGYCEVLMNKDTINPRVLPFRKADLRRLPGDRVPESKDDQ